MIFQVITYLSLLVLFIICYLSVKGRVTFGHGLGDVFFFIATLLITTVILAISIYFSIEMKSFQYLTLGATGFLIFTIVQITIFRGIELPWNGKVFFKF